MVPRTTEACSGPALSSPTHSCRPQLLQIQDKKTNKKKQTQKSFFFLSQLGPNTHSSVMSAQSCDMLTSGRPSERDRQAGGGMQRRRKSREEEEGGSTYRGGSGVFRSSRLPATQQRQEKFRKGGAVVVRLHGRTERDGTGRMEGRGRVVGRETTGEGMEHGGEREVRPAPEGPQAPPDLADLLCVTNPAGAAALTLGKQQSGTLKHGPGGSPVFPAARNQQGTWEYQTDKSSRTST